MKIVRPETVALSEGLNITTWGDEHYGYMRIKGLDCDNKPVDLILSTFRDLTILLVALDRLKEEETT